MPLASTGSSDLGRAATNIRCHFVVFADDVVDLKACAHIFTNGSTGSHIGFMTIGWDAAPAAGDFFGQAYGGVGTFVTVPDARTLSEGYHFASIYGSTPGGAVVATYGDAITSNMGTLTGGIYGR